MAGSPIRPQHLSFQEKIVKNRTSKTNFQFAKVLADEYYYYTVNYFNMMLRPELKKMPADNPLFKDTKEDDPEIQTKAMNYPSQTDGSMRFRFNVLEMDFSRLA